MGLRCGSCSSLADWCALPIEWVIGMKRALQLRGGGCQWEGRTFHRQISSLRAGVRNSPGWLGGAPWGLSPSPSFLFLEYLPWVDCALGEDGSRWPVPWAGAEWCLHLAGYSMFAVGIGALLFGYWSMMRWNRERR